MFAQFPFWQSHLTTAPEIWKRLVLPTDILVDATCGNGNDTTTLAQLVPHGKVWAFDIQNQAIQNTAEKLKTAGLQLHVELRQICHSQFPVEIFPESVRLFVYNLGYLPGSDKQCTTLTHTTLESLKNALPLLMPGGAISLTIYPGHPEGEKEREALIEFASSLSPALWMVTHLEWQNRENSPSLFFIFKALRTN